MMCLLESRAPGIRHRDSNVSYSGGGRRPRKGRAEEPPAASVQGASPLPGASADYARLVRFETQRRGELISKANIALG